MLNPQEVCLMSASSYPTLKWMFRTLAWGLAIYWLLTAVVISFQAADQPRPLDEMYKKTMNPLGYWALCAVVMLLALVGVGTVVGRERKMNLSAWLILCVGLFICAVLFPVILQ